MSKSSKKKIAWTLVNIHGAILRDGYGGLRIFETRKEAKYEMINEPEECCDYKIVKVHIEVK